MELFEDGALIFMQFFGGTPIYILQRLDPYSPGLKLHFMKVFRGECNFI